MRCRISALSTGTRHAINRARGFVLANGESTGLADGGHSLQAIGTHAGKNYASRVAPKGFCHGEHHHINRGFMKGSGWVIRETDRRS